MDALPILSMTYKSKIDEVCKPLSAMGLKHFAMYLVFNDQTTLVLSNVYPILRAYYYEELFREDFTYTPKMLSLVPNNYYFCKDEQSLSANLTDLFAYKYKIFPTYNIIRRHSECNFVFSAIRDKPLDLVQAFYDKSIKKFETFCSRFVNEFIDIIIESNQNYRHSFVLNNKSLRDAVISQGYIEQPVISPREQESLWHAAQGKSVKQIAQVMNIAPSTVESYLKKVREALHCSSLIEAIIEAMHRGIIGKVSPFTARPRFSLYKGDYARPFAA